MTKKTKCAAVLLLTVCFLILSTVTSCNKQPIESPSDSPSTEPIDTEATDSMTTDSYIDPLALPDDDEPGLLTPSPAPDPEIALVPYDGVVEHIFFHEVIAYPQLAFDGDRDAGGYDDYMVTASEYLKILESLYKNDFVLVNMNDVWSEYTNENGVLRMRRNTLMLPEGKKPIIISFDDISFYDYMEDDGFMRRLIIGEDGEIWAAGIDPNGSEIKTQDLAAVPILDKFVREHPDFSPSGAKGCIALTGYQGILGYRTQYDRHNDSADARVIRMQEVARVRPIITRLKETGWYFASHSYGHIQLDKASLDAVIADANRWMDEVASLVGETQLFIYPYGSRLDGGDVNSTGSAFRFYHDLGFRIFASVGYEPFSQIKSDISAVVCDRMNVDGIAFRTQRERHSRLYNVSEVLDPMRPSH